MFSKADNECRSVGGSIYFSLAWNIFQAKFGAINDPKGRVLMSLEIPWPVGFTAMKCGIHVIVPQDKS